MKKIIIILISGVLFFLGSSCESVLDVQPRNSLLTSTPLPDAKTYEAVVISVYDRIQSFTYWGRDMVLLGETLSDNAFVVTSEASGRYVSQNRNSKGSHFSSAIWSNAYGAINECNTVIAKIDQITDPDQAALRDKVKGEALFLRAFLYFDLGRIYGYEPTKVPLSGQGAGWDKSVILRLQPVVDVKDATLLTRSTQSEIYQSIEQDLKDAISLLQQGPQSSVFRGNLGAAYALLGKVYLYWEKWDLAVVNFDLALSNTSAKQITAGGYAGAFKLQPNTESLFEINFIQSIEVAGVTGINDSPFTYTQPTGTNALGLSTYGGMTPSAELLALFQPGDDRYKMFFVKASTTSKPTTYTWCNKYSGAFGQYTDNIPVIRYSDVVLMKAEALAEQSDYAGAAALVATLRTNRAAGVVPIPTDITVIDFILQERRRELFFEGSRWFDLKRKGRAITKPAATKVGALAYEDYRILAPLSSAEVTLNPDGLPQNPNY